MPKFRVKVVVSQVEIWEVDADDMEHASEIYGDGALIDASDDEAQVRSIYPVNPHREERLCVPSA